MADDFSSATLLLGWKWWKKTASEKYNFLFDEQGFPRGQAWGLIFVSLFILFFIAANIIGVYNFGTRKWFRNGLGDLVLVLIMIPILCETFYNLWWLMFWGVGAGHGIAKVFCEEKPERSYFKLAFLGNLITGLLTFLLIYFAAAGKAGSSSKDFWNVSFLPISFIISQLVGFVGLVLLKKYYQYRLAIEPPPITDTSDFSQHQTLDSHLTDGDPDN